MLNKKLVVALLSIAVLFLSVYSFAQGNDHEEEETPIVDDNDKKDDDKNDEEEETPAVVNPVTNNPGLTVVAKDTVAPVITLTGDNEIFLNLGETYTELGATVTDNKDNGLTATITGAVDTTKAGIYEVVYTATDNDGNKAVQLVRRVNVRPTIIGITDTTTELGSVFIAPTANLMIGGNATTVSLMATESTVNPNLVGVYELVYKYTMVTPLGNLDATPFKILVYVKDTDGPVITLDKVDTGKYAKKYTANITVTDFDTVAVVKYLWNNSETGINEESFASAEELRLDAEGKGTLDTNNVSGIYYLWVIAKDNNGNTTIERSGKYNLDNAIPAVTFVTNGNAEYARNHNTAVNVEDISGLNADRVRYAWTTGARPNWTEWFSKGVAFKNGDTITSDAGLTGTYYLWIMVEDGLGNRGYVKSESFNLDNTIPSVEFVSNGNETYARNHSTVVNVEDMNGLNTDRVRYAWTTGARPNWTEWFSKGVAFKNGDTITSDAGLTGTYYLWIMVEDGLGNRGYVKSESFNLDNTIPAVTFVTNGNTEYARSHNTVVNVEDMNGLNADRVRYAWTTGARPNWTEWFDKGVAFKNGDTITSDAGLTGTYYLWIMAEDGLGNRGYVKSESFTLDNTNPEFTVTGNAENWTNQDVTLTVNATDNSNLLASEAYSFDGGTTWQSANTKTFASNQNVNIIVKDKAGNTSSTIINITKIDKVKPEVISITQLYEPNEDGRIKATVVFNEPIKSMGISWREVNATTFYTYYYRTKDVTLNFEDLAGNTNTKLFAVDKTAPTGSISYNETSLTKNNVVATLQTSEPIKNITGWTKVSDMVFNREYSTNATETIMFEDLIGNPGNVNLSITNIDKELPVITVAPSTMSVEYGNTYDNMSGVSATDNVGTPVITSDYNSNILNTVGTYTIIYTATDSVGNIATATRTLKVVDSVAPSVVFKNNKWDVPMFIPIDLGYGATHLTRDYYVEDNYDSNLGATIAVRYETIPTQIPECTKSGLACLNPNNWINRTYNFKYAIGTTYTAVDTSGNIGTRNYDFEIKRLVETVLAQ